MNDAARTLKELALRYEFEPELCDIYVEGPSDKALLESFFEDCGRSDIAVYTIDSVNVPSTTVAKENLANNNRGRLISLGRFFLTTSPKN